MTKAIVYQLGFVPVTGRVFEHVFGAGGAEERMKLRQRYSTMVFAIASFNTERVTDVEEAIFDDGRSVRHSYFVRGMMKVRASSCDWQGCG